jgi:hypothetical protein
MRNGYANIAYTIGRGIDQRRECFEYEALSDRLLGLLDRLREKDDLESHVPASQTTKPRERQVYRRLAEIFEEAAAEQSLPGDRALLVEKAAHFRALARVAEEKAEARLLN